MAILMLHTHGGLIGSGLRFLSSTRNCLRVVILEGLLMIGLILSGLFIVSSYRLIQWSFVGDTRVFVDVTSVTIVPI